MKSSDDAPAPAGLWAAIKKAANRLQDWFAIQPVAGQFTVLAIAILIPVTGLYSFLLLQKQAAVAEQVRAMSADAKAGEGIWTVNDKLPVVFGTGSMLSFLETNPVERITVIYRPLTWSVSERIILIESQGKQYAYYPSDMETKIFTDKAVTAPWGGKLAFVPRGELRAGSRELVERLDQRFAGARPQSAKDSWIAGISAALSAALTIGLLAFLFYQLKLQYKSIKFIEPGQVHGSIEDLVGMDDIKAEVSQIKDQYQRRAAYAEYGISKPFNVMFSGPAGTGKTKLASYLAKELRLPILFHSAANLETGFVAGGSNTLSRIMAMAKRRKRCIVFLDEAQDLFMKRGGRRKFDDDTANTLLSVLDGVRSKHAGEIIWIVASNFNSETMQMDPAMLRRFQMKVDFRMPNREERLAIIWDAVKVLRQNPNAAVFLDAGHAHWAPAPDMADRLKRAGIEDAHGFALNTSNYVWDAENIKFGHEVSKMVGGAPFILDTSRNGNGQDEKLEWYNPPGRHIGKLPTTETGDPLIEAYLWLKRPGESDGECNGGPKAGAFWLDQALELAK